MKFIDILLSESKKSEFLANKQRDKLLSALKRDTFADQSMTAEDLTLKLEQLDPTNGKYLQWLVNMYSKKDFKMEDSPRITDALDNFKKKQRGLDKKDINQYNSLNELEDAVNEVSDKETISNKELKRQIKYSEAEVFYDGDDYSIISPKTERAACLYGRGTKWCTAYTTAHNMFNQYNQKGPLYIILDHKRNTKYQLHYMNGEFMDASDLMVKYQDLKKSYPKLSIIEDIIEKEILSRKDAKSLSLYAINVIKGRWPEVEPYIMKDAEYAYYYARYVIKGRWPEAEPYIMKNAFLAYNYAEKVIKGRWPEAESIIASNWGIDLVYDYVKDIVGYRCPDVEHRFLKSPYYINRYAEEVIKGRWPEAEPYIMKDAKLAYKYARRIIKGRWFEAEPVISQDYLSSRYYAEEFKLAIVDGKFVEKDR